MNTMAEMLWLKKEKESEKYKKIEMLRSQPDEDGLKKNNNSDIWADFEKLVSDKFSLHSHI